MSSKTLESDKHVQKVIVTDIWRESRPRKKQKREKQKIVKERERETIKWDWEKKHIINI